MNLSTLSKELTEAYEALTMCLEDQMQAETSLLSAEEWLHDSRCKILVTTDPKEIGANEAQREARLYTRCEEQESMLASAHRARVRARAATEKARARVEGLRCQLRIIEAQEGLRAAA